MPPLTLLPESWQYQITITASDQGSEGSGEAGASCPAIATSRQASWTPKPENTPHQKGSSPFCQEPSL